MLAMLSPYKKQFGRRLQSNQGNVKASFEMRVVVIDVDGLGLDLDPLEFVWIFSDFVLS